MTRKSRGPHCGAAGPERAAFATGAPDDYTYPAMIGKAKTQSDYPAPNRPGLVVTAVGPDRPGLVRELAGHIRKLGGNIEDTRMSKLGGEFAVLVLVTGEAGSLGELKASAPQLETALGVSCFFRDTSTVPRSAGTALYAFHASGVDHPGIVESVTDVLAARSINVTSFTSWIENAPLTGTPTFVIEAEVELPPQADYQELENSLSEACSRENLEFSLEKADALLK